MQWTKYVLANPGADAVHLGGERSLIDLDRVNVMVNFGIERRTDPAPDPTKTIDVAWREWPASGWCGDFSVTKRLELIRCGWPTSRLRIAQVTTPWGEEHAVLVVDRDDDVAVVLDSLTEQIKERRFTGYRWEKIQAQDNPNYWMAA